MGTSREVERIVKGIATSDGAGVKLTRVLTQDLQKRLDPFLMLDFFGSDEAQDYIGGFPTHPHRGFETVTYMLAGRMRHRDSMGNSGLLEPGGVQWMTAGSGLMHSEMPEQAEGLMKGFQLWVNLPARDKMTAPVYRDITSSQIPEVPLEGGGRARVIAGEFHGTPGAVQKPATEPLYLDLHLRAGQTLSVPVPAGHNAFVYVYEGGITLGAQAKPVQKVQMAVLSNAPDADSVTLSAQADSKLILVAGQPLHEPIAQMGPFVMNTKEEIQQTLDDYHAGRLTAQKAANLSTSS